MGISCDLLSFYYLCRTGNNVRLPISKPKLVVICFHFTIFVVLETTVEGEAGVLVPLWFAFILLSLSYWKQHSPATAFTKSCCDLLSFYYLCRTGNNQTGRRTKCDFVVICFHFTIFVVLETTEKRTLSSVSRCDLLSFYYLCRTGNNLERIGRDPFDVVICFHFTIFVVLETTLGYLNRCVATLWFAFILLSLSYWKQPIKAITAPIRGCDLLSFYYLCRTGNNHLFR